MRGVIVAYPVLDEVAQYVNRFGLRAVYFGKALKLSQYVRSVRVQVQIGNKKRGFHVQAGSGSTVAC